MKRITPLFISALLGGIFALMSFYWATRVPEAMAVQNAQSPNVVRALFSVEGMSCRSCEQKIRKALEAKAPVTAVAADTAQKIVVVDYPEGAAQPAVLAQAITDAGFQAQFVAFLSSEQNGAGKAATRQGGCGGGCCGN